MIDIQKIINFVLYLVIFIAFTATGFYFGIFQSLAVSIKKINDGFFTFIPTEFRIIPPLIIFALVWIFIDNRKI